MELNQQPQPYSPAFRDILYTVALDEVEKGGEISIFDSPVTRKIGIKKATEAPLFTLNVADYVRSQIEIAPLPVQNSGIIHTPERQFNSCIAHESWACTTPHTAGIVSVGTNRVLTDAFERRIGPGEQDEIAWVGEPGAASARALFYGKDGEPVEVYLGRRNVTETEMVALVLNGTHLAILLAERQLDWNDFSTMQVEIHADFKLIATFHYQLRPAADDKTRLGWWNRYGGIDHYTFDGARKEGIEIVKSCVDTGSRNLVLTSRSRKSGQAVAAVTTRGQAERLAGMAAAPQAWLVEQDGYIPVNITEKQVITFDEETVEIGFRYEYSQPELYPSF